MGFRVKDGEVVSAEVGFSVVKVEIPLLVMSAVVVGICCVAVTVDIFVAALLSSVLVVFDTRSVVFGVVGRSAVVASSVVTLEVCEVLETTFK